MGRLSWMRPQGQRGSAAVEFLAVLPFVVLVVMLIWQLVLVAYCLVVAEATARDVARAAASGQDYATMLLMAAENAPGMLAAEPLVITSKVFKRVFVTVQIRVPLILRGFDLAYVERQVVMPLEPGLGGG